MVAKMLTAKYLFSRLTGKKNKGAIYQMLPDLSNLRFYFNPNLFLGGPNEQIGQSCVSIQPGCKFLDGSIINPVKQYNS
ncbi:hypothetical protein CFP56_020070 [Quercus suber]|uniref:Uncharacterized protein n=1 Tax=Quercus suber TaxID=58331 RepID=A0AAW0KIT7_QUESU